MNTLSSLIPDAWRLSSILSWASRGPLLRPIGRLLISIFVVAGPWLLSVVALGVVSIGMEPVLGRGAIENMRLTIIYALCVAPLVGGPIGVVTARLIRSSIEDENGQMVTDIFLVATIVTGATTFIVAALVSFVIVTNTAISLAFIFLAVSTALLWNGLAVLSALRAHLFLFVAFACGTVFSILSIFLLARTNPTVELLIWSFIGGTVCCVALIVTRILSGQTVTQGGINLATTLLVKEISKRRYLVLGIFAAFCGVWVDKWVHWMGPDGIRSSIGFFHYGAYDSVMFLAHLSIIPTFALMNLLFEGEIKEAVREFRGRLRRRVNFALLRSSVDSLSSQVWNGIFAVIFIQATLTTTLVLIAPILSSAMHFDFAQFLMLRVGLVAAFVHSIFFLSSAVLLLCNQHRLFCQVQLIFLVTNLIFSTAFMLTMGPSAYGIFAGSLAASVVSFVIAYRSLHRYDFVSLVGENEGLYEARQ